MTFSATYPNIFLSLSRYASMLGFDEIQFFQGVTALKNVNQCSDVWYQFSWQDDQKVSREELRQAIRQSEEDLTRQLKYFPAPYWYSEVVDYSQFYQKEYKSRGGWQASGFNQKTVELSHKYVIQGGVRATSQIDTDDITLDGFIDTTGDSFDDTAKFTITNIDFTNICELKAYIKEYDVADAANTRTDPGSVGADSYWEVTPIRATLDGTTATVYVPSWLMFKPQLQRQISASEIDADSVNSYVDGLEFYRVYNDPSSQVTFLWTNESSCNSTACAWATQTGCMRVWDARTGIVTVQPGTYDATTSYFTDSGFTQDREPDKVIVNYYSGFREKDERNCDELSYYMAMNIAILASAKLNKTICSCESPARIIEKWQEDISLVNNVRSFNINLTDLSNPFGTKWGEIYVWNRIKNRGIRVGQSINVY